MEYKKEDIYKLHLGLMKYSDYQGKDFALVVYDYMLLISDIVKDLRDIIKPLEDYISGLQRIQRNYESVGEASSSELQHEYASVLSSYKEKHKKIIEQEDSIRAAFSKSLQEVVTIELPKLSYDVFPATFTAQDIEHFKIIIDR